MNIGTLSRTVLPLDVERWLGRRAILGPVALTVGATTLWAASLNDIRVRSITDIGLVSVLPPPFFLGFIVLTLGFCLTLRQRPLRVPLLLLHVVVLIFMLYGTTSIIEDEPRFHSVWKHLGVIDYITRNGRVDPSIDAYFNWPGFFILFAFVADIGHVQNLSSLVAWAPVFFNLIYFGPLLMIFRAVTDDERLVWLGIWLFYLTNWIGQDYFSPQALNYFFYLTILGILVKWFTVTASGPHPVLDRAWIAALFARVPTKLRVWFAPADSPGPSSDPVQRGALMAIVLALFVVVVASHQLTPFAVLISVTTLVVFNRSTARLLPLVMAVITLLWIRFMATAYMAGHGEQLAANVGDVGQAVNANAASRLGGSEGHLFIVYVRSVMTMAFWGVALLGGVRRQRWRQRDLTCVLLAVAPFPLLVLQPYGGEMVLRVYLFVLPFMAFFAAGLVFPALEIGRSWRTTAVIGVLSLTLFGAFLFTRYGNEKMDYATRDEVAAAEYLYNVAPPGSLLLVGTTNTPLKFRDYENYRYRSLTTELVWPDDDVVEPNVDGVMRLMDNRNYPAVYLLITRSQIVHDELFGLFPVRLAELERALTESKRFAVMYANDDAKILVRATDPRETTP